MIDLYWSVPEKTMLTMIFRDNWKREEFQRTSIEAYRMITSVDHDVKVLVDMSTSHTLPHNLVSMALSAMRMRSDNLGDVVVVTPSNLWSNLYQYLKRAYPRDVVPIKFVSSYQEAVTVLQSPVVIDSWLATRQLPGYTGNWVAPFVAV